MPRTRKPDHVRLLEGRSPGRDSGGRLVGPPRPVPGDDDPAPAPPMPRNRLSLPVRKVWRRTARNLTVTPDQDVMVAYCRDVVQQDAIAARIDAGELVPEGTQVRLAREVRRFRFEYMTAPKQPVAALTVAPAAEAGNPFGAPSDPDGAVVENFGRRREKVPSLIKTNPPGPMPRRYVENPCPPKDPKFHDVWVEAIRESDANHGITRPPGFYRREYHYDANNELWDKYWPADDESG